MAKICASYRRLLLVNPFLITNIGPVYTVSKKQHWCCTL